MQILSKIYLICMLCCSTFSEVFCFLLLAVTKKFGIVITLAKVFCVSYICRKNNGILY